jgi:hypothetical protein
MCVTRSRMLRSILLASSLLAIGCKKKNETRTTLPDEIEYRVYFFDADDKHGGDKRVPTLAGASLVLNGSPVATLVRPSATSSEVYASWKAPKAGINAVVGGTFVVRGKGACGTFDVPLEGPPPHWKGLKDDALAPYLERDGTLKFSNFVKNVPAAIDVLVDRGASAAKVSIGEVPIAERRDGTVTLANCTGPVPVLVDGKKVGDVDRTSNAYLVTLEPNVCHTYQTVGYGKYESGDVVHLSAKPVAPLSSKPIWFLEKAPDSEQVGGGGTVSSELLREPCPRK